MEMHPQMAMQKQNLAMPDGSQEWLQWRFDGLVPEDLVGEVPCAVYSVPRLVAPPAFQHIWTNLDNHHRVDGSVPVKECLLLRSAKVLLVLADGTDEMHLKDVKHLCRFVERYIRKQEKPHVILLQHSMMSFRPFDINEPTHTKGLVDSLRNGVDVVLEEGIGFKLAWAVQNKILRHNVATTQRTECIGENRIMLDTAYAMEWNLDFVLYDFLRVRLGTRIPPVDPSIEPGVPQWLGSLQLGAVLGNGAYGTVYKLMRDGNFTGQVLKTLPKHRFTDIHGLRCLRQQIQVMELLSSSHWKHPRIVQMLGIHHSESHILIRMQDGGSCDLRKRMRQRDIHHSPANLLSSRKVQSILAQISSGISHMHTGPGIAHLDIKPDNIIISETTEDIRISITDFDTAVIQPPLACHGVVGTYPFVAPEVYSRCAYNPFAADVWSMAVVFLEVGCCSKVLEKALRLHRLPTPATRASVKVHQKKMIGIVGLYFSRNNATKTLLDHYLHAGLQDMMGTLVSVLPDMLAASRRRATSSQVANAFCLVQERAED